MFDGKDDIKIVFLDEVDRVSAQYQDALKAFIEETSSKVRYIFTTNHIEKITPGNLSRFSKVNFDPQNEDEVKYLKTEYAKKLFHIVNEESVDIGKQEIVKIVNRSFPDMREMINTIQEISITGITLEEVDDSKNVELFNTVINNKDTNEVYHFLMNEYGDHNITHLMNTLGRPFIEYVGKSKSEYIPKMVDILELVTKYTDMLDNRHQDPIIVALACITQIQKIL
jgi:DNA polymerase III delta prime subunit